MGRSRYRFGEPNLVMAGSFSRKASNFSKS